MIAWIALGCALAALTLLLLMAAAFAWGLRKAKPYLAMFGGFNTPSE